MKQGRSTAAKTEVLKLISNSKAALSHADLQTALEGFCDRVTIYRVLDRLVAEGLVHKVIDIDGGVKYALCRRCGDTHQHAHLHFSCQKCRTVTCMEEVLPSFTLPANYQVHEVNFTVSGFCPRCA